MELGCKLPEPEGGVPREAQMPIWALRIWGDGDAPTFMQGRIPNSQDTVPSMPRSSTRCTRITPASSAARRRNCAGTSG